VHLRPGAYQLEIKQGDNTRYSEKIMVAAGKTIHISPGL